MSSETKGASPSKAFILKNAVSGDQARLLKLYNLISGLYDRWGQSSEPDVEMSVKIGKDKVRYNRYAIPVVCTPVVTLPMIERILEGMDAPPQLLEVIKARHARRIRMIVGCDCDSGGKRVYFHEGDRAYGYEFKDPAKFVTKRYFLVRKTDYPRVVEHFQHLGLADGFIQAFLEVFPLACWSQVCGRKNPLVSRENVIGYHISISPKVGVQELGRSLRELMGAINPRLAERGFDRWLQKNEGSYLSWIGIAVDRKGRAEATLYVRPDQEEWDEKYRPRDFLSFFGMEIMNM